MNDVTGLRAGDLISRGSYTWLCQAALSERSSQVTGVGSLKFDNSTLDPRREHLHALFQNCWF